MSKRRVLLIGLAIVITSLIALSKPLANAFSQPEASMLELEARQIINKPVPVKGTQIPNAVLTCVPNEGAKYELLGVAKQQETEYYLLSIYAYADEDPTERWDVVIQRDRAGCLLLHHLGSGLKPIVAYMPVETARQLELQRYQHWIERAGGKEKFQQVFIARAADSGVPHYLSEEQVWALKKLGISIPNTYRVLKTKQLV